MRAAFLPAALRTVVLRARVAAAFLPAALRTAVFFAVAFRAVVFFAVDFLAAFLAVFFAGRAVVVFRDELLAA